MSEQLSSVHNRDTSKLDDDDPLNSMLKKLGCYNQHVAVQECMFDNKDWRACKKQTEEFRKCYEENKKRVSHSVTDYQ